MPLKRQLDWRFFLLYFCCMTHTRLQIGRRRNLLKRYRAVMEEFDKHDCRYIPISVIYREFIYPKFHISRDTLYRILSTPIEEELQEINRVQPTLFD